MQTEKLNLCHQTLLEKKFQALNLSISEYCFANLYLFRQIHQFEIIQGEAIYIKGVTRDHFSFLMPTVCPQFLNQKELFSLLNQVDFLYPIPEIWIKDFPSASTVIFLDNDSDYLFKTEKMQNYGGRHLDSKRNFVKRFASHYTSTCLALSQAEVSDAIQILNEWQTQQPPKPETDYESCLEALQLLDQFNLSGKILYADQHPIAFLIGEEINHQTYSIHFMKAKKDYIGAYPFLYQQLALSLPPHIHYLNLEQDLGLINLRQTKSSYHPDEMLHKYRLTFH